MDREKVIKGLEKAVEVFDGRISGPMFEMWMDKTKDAIALLKAQEAQEAVKPIIDIDTWVCGKCGARVERQSMAGPNVLIAEQLDVCPNCGRAVKWE